MKIKEKISLEKVFEKEYKTKIIELESNKEAVITHFLHNSKNGVSQYYKKDAVKFTKEILENSFRSEFPFQSFCSLITKINSTSFSISKS